MVARLEARLEREGQWRAHARTGPRGSLPALGLQLGSWSGGLASCDHLGWAAVLAFDCSRGRPIAGSSISSMTDQSVVIKSSSGGG